MRIADADALAAEVAGTTVGDRLEVNAWRGGLLLAQDLEVTSWSLRWDAGRQVQGQASITIADPTGELAPWSLADPLAPGGSRLQLTWVSGLSGTVVPLGWWRIRRVEPVERWRLRRLPGSVERISGGGSVTVDADEETSSIVLFRLDADVVIRPTVIDEVTRILADVVPVSPTPGLPDGPVPSGFVYGDSRMDAVEDLLAAIFAVHRMGPDGSLELVPAAGVGPVWTVEGGDDGVLVSLVRALSDEGVYNAAISSGETAAGQPLVGRAYTEAGTLAWGGPYGRVPIFHQAVAQTAAGVQADARTVLATLSSAGEVDLEVVCLTHPGIQVHDLVTLVASTAIGGAPMVGRVVAMSMSSSGGSGVTPAKAMSLTVRVAAEALEAIGGRVARER